MAARQIINGIKSPDRLPLTMSVGKVKLVSNMTGSGNLETFEGTWSLEGDKLTFSLLVNDNPGMT